MKIFSKNTISFPEQGSLIQRVPSGSNPKIKRITNDGVVPVILRVTGGDGSTINAGDYIFPGSFISERFAGRIVGAPSALIDTFDLIITDGNAWNTFPTTEIDFFVATAGTIRRISADGVFPIVLEYDENVKDDNLIAGKYIYYNSQIPGEEIYQLTPRKIILQDEINKQITIGDFLITDPDTGLINFNEFPLMWTSNWKFSDFVQIIHTTMSGTGNPDEYEVYYEITGKRTENVLLYLDWDFVNSVDVLIKPHYYGYFYPDKVAAWYSVKEIYKSENYFADTIETINVDTSSFEERKIEIGGAYKLIVPLNVPASVRFIKLVVTTKVEELLGELFIDIKENVIGFRN